jgi:hypothetical protein
MVLKFCSEGTPSEELRDWEIFGSNFKITLFKIPLHPSLKFPLNDRIRSFRQKIVYWNNQDARDKIKQNKKPLPLNFKPLTPGLSLPP